MFSLTGESSLGCRREWGPAVMGEGSLGAASAPLPSCPLPSASFCLKGGAVLRGTGPEVGPRGRGLQPRPRAQPSRQSGAPLTL